MTKPTIKERAAGLSASRASCDHLGCDGTLDDMILSGEIEEMIQEAISRSVAGLTDQERIILAMRVRAISIDIVDLVAEDFANRELLA